MGKLQSHWGTSSEWLEERVLYNHIKPHWLLLLKQNHLFPAMLSFHENQLLRSNCFKLPSVYGFWPGNRENVMTVRRRYCLMCQLQNSSSGEAVAPSCVYEDLHLWTMETPAAANFQWLSTLTKGKTGCWESVTSSNLMKTKKFPSHSCLFSDHC